MVLIDVENTTLLADAEIPVLIKSSKIKSVKYGALEFRLRNGVSLELPLKVAVPLLREGMAEVDESKLPSFAELNKLRWKEERTEDLQPIPSDFYIKARLYLDALKKHSENDKRKEILFRKSKAAIIDIITSRMKKIVRHALSSLQPSRNILENMSYEERILYIALCHLLEEWYRLVVDKIERGGV